MDTTESIAITAMTLVTNSLTAFFTHRAAGRKLGKEGDALISDAIVKRTQQLFENISHVMEEQQKEINVLKHSLTECHQQHATATQHHNETLRRLETLEAALRSSL